jgi:hypothetical protein
LTVDKMSEDSEAEPLAVGEVDDGAFAGPGGEIRFRHYVPLVAAEGKLPTLIYYHGGGFVIGNLETHDSTCRRLANKSRCQVIAIDYRLSPEHPFPAPIEDAWQPSAISATTPTSSEPMRSASPWAAIRRGAPSPPWSPKSAAMPARPSSRAGRRSRC